MGPDEAPRVEDLPQVIPLFPLDGALMLPHATRPFNIFEPRYLNLLDDVMAAERNIGMDEFLHSGSPQEIYQAAGFDAAGLRERFRKMGR